MPDVTASQLFHITDQRNRELITFLSNLLDGQQIQPGIDELIEELDYTKFENNEILWFGFVLGKIVQ